MGKLFSILCGVMLLTLMIATVAAVSMTGAQIVLAMFLAGLIVWDRKRRRSEGP
ncbi:MAG TPA: hypothetical protein VEF55_14600 [Candidatus Binatia bacterium]|nr:hypothetical protein [Candidatus Binatia bacterium]